jgi:hypothetical protein
VNEDRGIQWSLYEGVAEVNAPGVQSSGFQGLDRAVWVSFAPERPEHPGTGLDFAVGIGLVDYFPGPLIDKRSNFLVH